MNTNLINLSNLSKIYKKGGELVSVFEKLNFSVERGKFIAIMGASGSGKTSLLNIIGGLDRSNEGSVEVFGQNLSLLSSQKFTEWRSKNVGYVFQQNFLIPILDAAKNVEVPLYLTNLNKKQRDEKVNAALELVDLLDRKNHKPKELSGGQEQRVGIARAIVKNPSILLCDEPTGNLDATSSTQILHLLRLLNEEYKKTIFIVTHDPAAAKIADESYILRDGKLELGMMT